MSNTVITNYTDLNGPSTKADSSVVVIVNKDGSLSVDENLLGTLMGTDGSQGAGISVVRVGHEGRPDDATDSDNDDDKVPHVTLTVDSYYDEPNSIIKYDSGAEMLQSLRIETRENSLLGFQNDHCYTPLTSPLDSTQHGSDSYAGYDEPVIEIKHQSPPKTIPSSKKITILEQTIIPPKGRKVVKQSDAVATKRSEVPSKKQPGKSKQTSEALKAAQNSEDSDESSLSSSEESIQDRDSDSDYKETKDKSVSLRKTKVKARILKNQTAKPSKLEPKAAKRIKANKNVLKRELKEKLLNKRLSIESQLREFEQPKSKEIQDTTTNIELKKDKQTPKAVKKEKKTPAHVTALLSDMTSLFSTPDVIRRVSTDNKTPTSTPAPSVKKDVEDPTKDKVKKSYGRQTTATTSEKTTKGFDLIPQIDDASLAQILQDTTGISTAPVKSQTTITTANAMNSPGLGGPLSPTLDLLASLQPEEEGLTEDLLMHVAQLVESSENLQEVIDKQVLGKVDTAPAKVAVSSPFQEAHNAGDLYTPSKSVKTVVPRKDPIEIVRRDGRVITLPPIEAPATRASKRKSQMESASTSDVSSTPPTQAITPPQPVVVTPEPQVIPVSKQYINKKLVPKKLEPTPQPQVVDKAFGESQDSWNSEDDPNRLWCICRQPHNNRFMICCDGCEDWFHGKCVNITKVMGQQMEEQGIEWRCPNCMKKPKTPKDTKKRESIEGAGAVRRQSGDIRSPRSSCSCIVCKKPARASSIYCSDACILKHAQDSLGVQGSPSKTDEPGREKLKSESRVIVFERKTGRCLAGINAPTAENLKAWLQKNPTFEVVRPETLNAIKPKFPPRKALQSPQSPEQRKVQTMLNFERIQKKLPGQAGPGKLQQSGPAKVLQPGGPSKVPQLVGPTKAPQPGGPTKVPQSGGATKVAQLSGPAKLLQPGNPAKAQQGGLAKVPQPGFSKADTPKMGTSKPLPLTPKMATPTRETPTPRTPGTPKLHLIFDNSKASTSTARPGPSGEPKRQARPAPKLQPSLERPSVSPAARRKEVQTPRKMDSDNDSIRENVRKALQEQIGVRMTESSGKKFNEKEIKQFANETEAELHELFRDVGVKYKAKYRSLMFNIKDRKNLSLWQKICDKAITPKDLVRLSPEELASQELAQWRDQESKHQLELIKKSELDLLAASKTYVLKTHKGEEVMETKTAVSTELDPDVPVEDVVSALNDSTLGEDPAAEGALDTSARKLSSDSGDKHPRKREREDSDSHKKSRRDSKRDADSKRSKSSRKRSDSKQREERPRRSSRRSDRVRSPSRERPKPKAVTSKEKADSGRSRRRSRSRGKSRRSKSREHSRSRSQGRDRSHSRGRSKRRSRSRNTRRNQRSHSKHRPSQEDVAVRSRSQENTYSKSKNDSTDSDSVERPKSAMMKEVHPEYDPHEPMITSANSEEDLRKTGEDVYEDSFKAVATEMPEIEYDSSKTFTMDSDIVLPQYPETSDKPSEVESDQEPSSTVDNSTVTVWNGCINMVDVARFYVSAHEVSGISNDLEDDLSAELDIVGRINPHTVWDYINKMKRTGNKDIVVLRLQAANDEEKMQYIALYSYLSSRNRLGVVKVSNTTTVKDLYIVPLPASAPLPKVLLPLDGPGLEEAKNHLLIAIIIRQRKKRAGAAIPKDIIPAKVVRSSRKRSYTPPPAPAVVASPAALAQPPYTSPALSTSVKDKIAASLAAADEDEAYSPGSSSNESAAVPPAPAVVTTTPAAPSDALRCKMEELNRQIEEQKQQIMKIAQADTSVVAGGDEAYSPSRPMTPSPPANPLDGIALPSNLHEILATIKQRTETANATDVDMRTLTS